MRAALVYQAGIANVFRVGRFAEVLDDRGDTVRLLQNSFGPCEWFARGLRAAGWEVKSYHCNRAGDVQGSAWSPEVEDAPFYSAMQPVYT